VSSVDADLTTRASIRNAALALFAEHGPDRVTVRQIASTVGVSPALVLHHFGSKDGLRASCDELAARAFDAVLEHLETSDADAMADALTGPGSASVAEAFARGFPPGSPLPAYLRRLLLAGDPAGRALFGRWFSATRRFLDELTAAGVARPTADPDVRAAFLLANDLALVLLRDPIANAIGADPLSPDGMARWAAEATAVYADGAFQHPTPEE
jgi:AcrR family transcriptional regulator